VRASCAVGVDRGAHRRLRAAAVETQQPTAGRDAAQPEGDEHEGGGANRALGLRHRLELGREQLGGIRIEVVQQQLELRDDPLPLLFCRRGHCGVGARLGQRPLDRQVQPLHHGLALIGDPALLAYSPSATTASDMPATAIRAGSLEGAAEGESRAMLLIVGSAAANASAPVRNGARTPARDAAWRMHDDGLAVDANAWEDSPR